MSDPLFLTAAEIGTGGALALGREFYADADIFERERSLIFLDRWLCAGRAEQIPHSGDYFVRDVGAESIVAVRGEDSRIRVHHNVCRHRGARLCEAAAGRFGRAIRCPYHAWTYGLDGRLAGAPSMDGTAGFDRENYGLHPAALAVWEGFVFVSFSASPEPFPDAFAPVWTRFERFHLAALRARRRIDYDVRANWKLIFENYSECYHCGPVHPALVKLSPAESGGNDLIEGPFLGGYMELTTPAGSLTQSGQACARPVGPLTAEDRQRVYYYTLFPNLLLSLHPDYVMAHTLWPEAPDRTRIECEWLFHPEAEESADFAPDDAVEFWDRTNREDWRICEQCQRGVSSRAYVPGPLSPREAITAAFDREYLRAMGAEL